MNWKNNHEIKSKHYNHNYGKHYHNGYERDHQDGFTAYSPTKTHYAGYILRKVWSDRKLRLLMICSVILIKVIFVLALVFLLPALGNLFEFLKTEGIKGILESVIIFAQRIWYGA